MSSLTPNLDDQTPHAPGAHPVTHENLRLLGNDKVLERP